MIEPVEPVVKFWAEDIVSWPSPTFCRATAPSVASVKRVSWPEKIVEEPSRPTTKVAAEVLLFITLPAPAKEPQTVVAPLRLRKVLAARVSAE